MSDALDSFLNAITSLIEAVVSFWKGFFQAFGVDIQALLTNIWNGIKTIITNAIEAIKTTIKTKWTDIKSWLSTTLAAIKDKFGDIFDAIKKGVAEKITNVKDKIVEGMENAADYIKSLPEKFYNWGCDMVQGIIDGITAKIEAVKTAAANLAGAIAGYIHFSTPDVGPLADADKFMPDFMNLLVSGINNGIPKLTSAMSGLASSMIPSMSQIQGGQTSNSIVVNVYGAQGQNVSELADIIEERITENVMRRGAAFG